MEHRQQQAWKVLVVDDDSSLRRLFRALLARRYAVEEAASGQEAIEIATCWSPDLVLLDLMMPGLDGYQTCRELKALPAVHPPQVIVVSAKSDPTELARGFEVGADDYLTKPIEPSVLRSRVELHFRLRDSQMAAASLQGEVDSHHSALRRAAEERTEEILALQDVAVLTLAKVAESRDNETGAHVLRLRDYAQLLARELASHGPYAGQIDEHFLADLYRASPLHDIGKVGIPDAILLKPGRLTPKDIENMRRHTVIGSNILNEAVMQCKAGGFLTMAALVAQFHHEWWNGQGYPAGLVGKEIPLAARIVSVGDVYDALTSKRPYKEAWAPERAKQMIEEGAGKQFDPVVVAAFDRCFDGIREIQQKHVDQEPTATGAMCFREYDQPEPV